MVCFPSPEFSTPLCFSLICGTSMGFSAKFFPVVTPLEVTPLKTLTSLTNRSKPFWPYFPGDYWRQMHSGDALLSSNRWANMTRQAYRPTY